MRIRFLLVALLLFVAACSTPATTITTPATPTTAALAYERLLPAGVIQVLDMPPTVPANAVAGHIQGNDPVMGLKIGDEARAYPVGVMRRYEIANDVLGGQPVGVTYCPSCNTGIAFSRQVNGQTYNFEVSGLTLDNALVLTDRETGSNWAQARLQAVEGPLTGTNLELLVTNQISWSEWVAQNPNTTLVIDPRAPVRNTVGIQIPVVPSSNAAQPDDVQGYVVGIASNDTAVAYPLDTIEAQGVINVAEEGIPPIVLVHLGEKGAVAAWSREVNGQILTFSLDNGQLVDSETGTTWDARTGQAVGGELQGAILAPADVWITDWRGWLGLWPGTTLIG